jgi:hypothetical protein
MPTKSTRNETGLTRVIPLGDARVGSRESERVGTPVWVIEVEVSRYGRDESDQQSFEHFGNSCSGVLSSDDWQMASCELE